jgi:hypothetical protein
MAHFSLHACLFLKTWIHFLIVKLYIFSINYFDIVIMSNAIIHNVAYDNYDEFQPINFIFFTKFHFTILRIS